MGKVVVENDERIDKGVLRWFGHVERMENDRIAKRVYAGELAGRPWSKKIGEHCSNPFLFILLMSFPSFILSMYQNKLKMLWFTRSMCPDNYITLWSTRSVSR